MPSIHSVADVLADTGSYNETATVTVAHPEMCGDVGAGSMFQFDCHAYNYACPQCAAPSPLLCLTPPCTRHTCIAVVRAVLVELMSSIWSPHVHMHMVTLRVHREVHCQADRVSILS